MADDPSSTSANNNGSPVSGDITGLPLSTVRSLLRGRCIVVEGGQLTAEAREPDRKRRLHEQLRCARRLRAVMESAANRAERSGSEIEVKHIMISNAPHMEELVSLTEAVRGGYTLDSYREENAARQQEQVESKRAKEGSVNVHAHLKSMAEEWHGVIPKKYSPRKKKNIKRSQKSSPTKSLDRSDRNSPLKPHEPSSVEVLPVRNDSNSYLSSTKKQKTGKSGTFRRCHYCKETKENFRLCHFWFVNGTKCGKTFCNYCLVQHFNAPSIVGPDGKRWNRNDTDWHCPSCLQKCDCSTCKKKQSKETRKVVDSTVGERKSNRPTARTFYSAF